MLWKEFQGRMEAALRQGGARRWSWAFGPGAARLFFFLRDGVRGGVVTVPVGQRGGAPDVPDAEALYALELVGLRLAAEEGPAPAPLTPEAWRRRWTAEAELALLEAGVSDWSWEQPGMGPPVLVFRIEGPDGPVLCAVPIGVGRDPPARPDWVAGAVAATVRAAARAARRRPGTWKEG